MKIRDFQRSAAIALFGCSLGTALAAPVPIEAFARLPKITGPTISLDGRYIAYIARIQNENVAGVLDLTTRKFTPVLRPDKDGNVDINWCRWGNDTRVVCSFTTPLTMNNGKAYGTTRIAGVDADGIKFKVLMGNLRLDYGQYRDQIIDWTADDPRTVLLQGMENRSETGTIIKTGDPTPAVFKLDIYTGGVSKALDADPSIQDFRTDGNGEVRLGTGIYGTTRVYKTRLIGEKKWRVLSKMEVYKQRDRMNIMRVIPGTNKAHAMGGSGRQALWEIDLEDKLPPKLIFEHPLVDIDYFEYERTTGKLLGYSYDTDRPFFRYEDERLGSVMSAINKALPGSFNRTVSFTDDMQKHVIFSSSDVNPGAYYLYDATTRKLAELGKTYPELDTQSLGRMQAIEYPAKDGTKIPGYLTVPPNVRAEKVPLIVMPHDGPDSRTYLRFDYLRQFLVSRGYAVLEMNFRGSTGYGYDWQNAAYQDWGGLPYSDIYDATRWAIAQGIADPARICIAGRGFGGYSALLGVVRNSDTYKCAVSISGFTDLITIVDDSSFDANPDAYKERFGTNRAKLKEDSPLNHLDQIKSPVLLIHGALDVVVPVEQSQKIAKGLKSAKKDHKYVELKEGDNSFTRQADRETMLREIDAFLSAHLGTAVSP